MSGGGDEPPAPKIDKSVVKNKEKECGCQRKEERRMLPWTETQARNKQRNA